MSHLRDILGVGGWAEMLSHLPDDTVVSIGRWWTPVEGMPDEFAADVALTLGDFRKAAAVLPSESDAPAPVDARLDAPTFVAASLELAERVLPVIHGWTAKPPHEVPAWVVAVWLREAAKQLAGPVVAPRPTFYAWRRWMRTSEPGWWHLAVDNPPALESDDRWEVEVMTLYAKETETMSRFDKDDRSTPAGRALFALKHGTGVTDPTDAPTPEPTGAEPDSAWSLRSCVEKLIEGADLLLGHCNYDGHGHEEIQHARDNARLHLAAGEDDGWDGKENVEAAVEHPVLAFMQRRESPGESLLDDAIILAGDAYLLGRKAERAALRPTEP